ncbi:hypothetical protein AAH011_03780 [Parabacteroides distasonis]|jgi:hypothetical protein|uniref:Uncharacterized protein n=1 Tax=Parabacteroides distasonis TaxID=823 RepID=A0AB35J3H0_PARDI|nr:hypothetical protein [Parabacteroides distasonis]MDB9003724.1 hypothetical protein [Parabacteroides distasonis]MDB9007620.1 hypothetical protein [Parabacteroides distasonis]MDB9020334.1 hypothetical protein [Parabacteroides distasonis]
MKKLSILLLSLAAMGAFAFVLPSLPTGQSGAYPTETAFMAEAEEMFQKGNKLYEQGLGLVGYPKHSVALPLLLRGHLVGLQGKGR